MSIRKVVYTKEFIETIVGESNEGCRRGIKDNAQKEANKK